MSTLANVVAGRRSKWVVLAVWIVVALGAGAIGGRFEKAQKNDPASFLPAGAESLKVLELGRTFPGGTVTPAVVVYRNADGLTPANRAAIEASWRKLNGSLPAGATAAPPPVYSDDGKAALVTVPINAHGSDTVLTDAVDEIRTLVRPVATDGLVVKVSGPAGFSADASKVFKGINGKLLLATGLLVFVLLVLIYRSPIFWFLPLLALFAAEATTRAFGYGIAKAGVIVNGQSGGILLVLVFGAGTDYALLLTARYREELHRHEDPHDAMRVAVRTTGPALLASAGTVIAALLCLALARVNATSGLGPIGAMGIAVALVTMLTLLPVLLILGGRKAFWPLIPRLGAELDVERAGLWRRLAGWIERRHRPVALFTALALGACCLGMFVLDDNLTSSNGFRGTVESVQGQKLIADSFPAGANAPAIVLVTDPAKVDDVRRAALAAPGVAAVGKVEEGPAGARFEVTLKADPYSKAGYALIPPLREAVRTAGGDAALVGGPTAEEHDLRAASSRDVKLLVPIVLAVVFLILALLLRALVAPVVLMLTVILSFFATLGISALFFRYVFHFPGEDPSFPLYAFIFLVALGVDYNIFLMARVREEAVAHGTMDGMKRGLAVTGSVITSAGVVLAGTFAVLAVLPITALTQIGFAVGVGVLLDTLVVRSILVPALVFELRDRTWLPSALARRAGRSPAVAAEAET